MTLENFCPECLENTECTPIEIQKVFEVRDEKIEIKANYLRCNQCDEIIPDPKLDEENFQMIYAEYRRRKKLLHPHEIVNIRNKYGLSQRQLAKILGWSHATLSRYETGALQSPSHNLELVLLENPENMLTVIERNTENLTHKEIETIRKRVNALIEQEQFSKKNWFTILERLFTKKPSKYTGFKEFNFDKLVQMVKFFAQRDSRLYKVKLMKYLWYADFLNFKRSTLSISGLQYTHMQLGPVPDEHEALLTLLTRAKEHIQKEYVDLGYENPGELYRAVGDFDDSLFDLDELKTLEDVYEELNHHSSTSISNYSHKEMAWLDTIDGEIISYEYARDLSLS